MPVPLWNQGNLDAKKYRTLDDKVKFIIMVRALQCKNIFKTHKKCFMTNHVKVNNIYPKTVTLH